MKVLFVFAVLFASAFAFEDYEVVGEHRCEGTTFGMINSLHDNPDEYYGLLVERYSNCTHVDGNLELAVIRDNFDMSFLRHIQEVTGYVMLHRIQLDHLSLPHLRKIHGQKLFSDKHLNHTEFGMFVGFSSLKTLELPALREISHGSVGVVAMKKLCNIETIEWDSIFTGEQQSMVVWNRSGATEKPHCLPCDSSCEKGCWAHGASNCQYSA